MFGNGQSSYSARAASAHTGYQSQGMGGTGCRTCCDPGGLEDRSLTYVGGGRGGYVMDPSYKYVGSGGDFEVARRPKVGTYLPVVIPVLSGLILLPLLFWMSFAKPPAFDCNGDVDTFEISWSKDKAAFCCEREGRGCNMPVISTKLAPAMPQAPPLTTLRPPPRPQNLPPADPFNCAVGAMQTWLPPKKDWCCKVHHLGCPPTPPPPAAPLPPAAPAVPAAPAFLRPAVQGQLFTAARPFDCAAGFGNWIRGWSSPKKDWCCKNEGKGCTQGIGGCA